ncbi:ABC transporter ATP-binding protein [Algihabitans albus]|uniref:ABC transporter ATP-binding protein n=1 Tax=Algihabitans albus TaxID=2164067 RepID=UPI000E5CB1B3|nr:ABC transporter ATP-binding protein [Algihabitans albus]
MLEARSLTKRYDGQPALQDLSLDLRDNEYLTLLGPSGSGKSTLLRLIAGFDVADRGELLLDGQSLNGVPPHERGIGFVSQGFALFPHMTVFDNVAFGLRYSQRDPVKNEADVRRRVVEMLDLVGLADLGDRMTGQISGGQKQRVALARTLVVNPRVCLLDEPLGALDANLRQRMTVELRRIRKLLGISFMHVTGNELEALSMGDRVVVLDQGRALQVDEPDRVYNRPNSAAVARFLNRYNIFEGKLTDGGGFAFPGGELPLPDSVPTNRDAASYCIRYDRIQVRGMQGAKNGATDAPVPEGSAAASLAQLPARYITSEYSGSAIIYFFRLADEKVVEVEYHLSHRKPDAFTEGDLYTLAWPREEALVYA